MKIIYVVTIEIAGITSMGLAFFYMLRRGVKKENYRDYLKKHKYIVAYLVFLFLAITVILLRQLLLQR
jgi:hypothetical protein